MPKAQYAAGAQLVFAGPAHTGYPSGANVFVTRVRADGEAWLYDVLIKIGPSDHQMVKAAMVHLFADRGASHDNEFAKASIADSLRQDLYVRWNFCLPQYLFESFLAHIYCLFAASRLGHFRLLAEASHEQILGNESSPFA